MMVKAGLTPMQALVAAEGRRANVKLDSSSGRSKRKDGNLVVLNANPLTDIANTPSSTRCGSPQAAEPA